MQTKIKLIHPITMLVVVAAFFLNPSIGYPDVNLNLLNAVSKKQIAGARTAIKGGADVNHKTPPGITPLAVAAMTGDFEIVEYLLNKGANPNIQISDKSTPLMIASAMKATNSTQKDQIEIVKLLLKKMSEGGVNIQNNVGMTALIAASSTGHSGLVNLLLDNGADPNAMTKEGVTSLILASTEGHLNIVKRLLKEKQTIDVDRTGSFGITPLIFASMGGHEDIVKVLLESGADINAKTDNGFTALLSAQKEGQSKIVKFLLKKERSENKKGQKKIRHKEQRVEPKANERKTNKVEVAEIDKGDLLPSSSTPEKQTPPKKAPSPLKTPNLSKTVVSRTPQSTPIVIPDISGDWRVFFLGTEAGGVNVEQDNWDLKFLSPGRPPARGKLAPSGRIHGIDWNVTGKIEAQGKKVSWSNGVTWLRK